MTGMRFTAPADRLSRALADIRSVPDHRVAIPILGCARITADATAGTVSLTVTNMDTEVTRTLDADVRTGGVAAIPLRPLQRGLHALRGAEPVTVTTGGAPAGSLNATIAAGDTELAFDGSDPDDFPTEKARDPSCSLTMPASALRALLRRVVCCASREDTRYYLNGVFLHRDAGRLVSVATDGHRLLRFSVPEPAGIRGAWPRAGVIVPRRLVDWLIGALPGAKDDPPVELTIVENAARIGLRWDLGDGDAVSVIAKLIDGTFPDYRRVVPTYGDVRPIEIDVARFRRGLKIVETVFERSDKRYVRLSADGTRVVLETAATQGKRAKTAIPCAYTGAPVTVGIDAAILAPLLNQFTAPTVFLRLGLGLDPILITATDDPDLTAVIMPLRV